MGNVFDAAGRGAFHQQDIDKLSAAYDAVLCELAENEELTLGPAAGLPVRDIRTLIARAIIAKALGGERSIQELTVAGLSALRRAPASGSDGVVVEFRAARARQNA